MPRTNLCRATANRQKEYIKEQDPFFGFFLLFLSSCSPRQLVRPRTLMQPRKSCQSISVSEATWARRGWAPCRRRGSVRRGSAAGRALRPAATGGHDSPPVPAAAGGGGHGCQVSRSRRGQRKAGRPPCSCGSPSPFRMGHPSFTGVMRCCPPAPGSVCTDFLQNRRISASPWSFFSGLSGLKSRGRRCPQNDYSDFYFNFQARRDIMWSLI